MCVTVSVSHPQFDRTKHVQFHEYIVSGFSLLPLLAYGWWRKGHIEKGRKLPSSSAGRASKGCTGRHTTISCHWDYEFLGKYLYPDSEVSVHLSVRCCLPLLA
jgi:hypothetical protein